MPLQPILFAGGSGTVGRQAVHWFRQRQPDWPLLVGGRNLATAEDVAQAAGQARAVGLDLDQPGLGLDPALTPAAIIMLAPDQALHGLSLAQRLGIPYLNANTGVTELGPEVAQFMHHPGAHALVLSSHWASGAALALALDLARRFTRVVAIGVEVLLDEEDPAGPLAWEDMARVHSAAPAALAFRHGRRHWLSGADLQGSVTALDGRTLAATAFGSIDLLSLWATTAAPELRFDIAMGESSSRRRGAETAAEIAVRVTGERDGQTTTARSVLEFSQGQASLTALGLVLSLERALGLVGGRPLPAGLYMPEQLWAADWFLQELQREGAVLHHPMDGY
ncbi:hypothetical protein [Pseudomonas oryzihabitans]|uniref:hypothetical protein n=1 Tax=Pseudomonas oryzihabitans TaxID=47885 RepID=UPI0011A918DB|nr:hypothetical protein [Pseudomonas oryzihabitans]